MRRLIFSINSGRAGSKYLARILGTARGVRARHEPRPHMSGRLLTELPAEPTALRPRLFATAVHLHKMLKILALYLELARLPPSGVYAETTHRFIHGFDDAVPRHFRRRVTVVVLRRYLPSVVKSLHDLGDFAPGDAITAAWYAAPNAPSAAVRALASDDDLDHIDRIIAYLIDVEARAQRFARRYPEVPIVEVRVESLDSRAGIREFFDALALEPTERTVERTATSRNRREEHKIVPEERVSLDLCRQRIERYLERCQRAGIELPELPQLEASARCPPTISKGGAPPDGPCSSKHTRGSRGHPRSHP